MKSSIGIPTRIQRFRNGNLVVHTSDVGQVRILLLLSEFCGLPVSGSLSEQFNSVLGLVSGPALRTLTDDEIVECAAERDGVVSA